MRKDDIEEVVESGERLPAAMWESDMPNTIMQSPVFDGEKIIDQGN